MVAIRVLDKYYTVFIGDLSWRDNIKCKCSGSLPHCTHNHRYQNVQNPGNSVEQPKKWKKSYLTKMSGLSTSHQLPHKILYNVSHKSVQWFSQSTVNPKPSLEMLE